MRVLRRLGCVLHSYPVVRISRGPTLIFSPQNLHTSRVLSAKNMDKVTETVKNVLGMGEQKEADGMEGRSKTGQQQTDQPGKEHKMDVKPVSYNPLYKPGGKLRGKNALITGGDSGIGRSIAIHFALEGANVAIACLAEEIKDAEETKRLCEANVETLVREMIKVNPESEKEFLEEMKTVRKEGTPKVVIVTGDIGSSSVCKQIVDQTIQQLGSINILVNNAGRQVYQEKLEDISEQQLKETYDTNIFSMFYLAKLCLPQMKKGDTIINCTSVTAYAGNENLIDYASTKGAIVAFTRSLALNIAEKGIRVNGVAPGPILTPLIPATFPSKKVKEHGKDTPLGRQGEPCEVAPCFVFLASFDSNYITGQVFHPNGGRIVNG